MKMANISCVIEHADAELEDIQIDFIITKLSLVKEPKSRWLSKDDILNASDVKGPKNQTPKKSSGSSGANASIKMDTEEREPLPFQDSLILDQNN